MSKPNAKSNKTDPKTLEVVKAKPDGKTPAKPQNQTYTKTPPAGATRIAKRDLWWKEPPSEKKIPPSKPFKPVISAAPRIDDKNLSFTPAAYNGKKIATQALNWNAVAKVDDKNLGFQPAPYNGKKIETQALNWNGNSVVDTWQNINHQPGGGNAEIIDDKQHFDTLPRIDCGFNYEYQ